MLKLLKHIKNNPHLIKKALLSLYQDGWKMTLLKMRSNVSQNSYFNTLHFDVQNSFHALPLTQSKPKRSLKIAVVIHAFYIDVLEDIIGSIDNIVPRPDLFISLSQDANLEEVEQFLDSRGYKQRKIIQVQNRGRDIAPFLIDFAPFLQAYDLCCKIHGKKSLYSGKDRSDWRGHLYHNLLGSREIVDDIVVKFEQDTKLGLLFSDNFGMLPYAGYTWLTNKAVVQRLLLQLGLEKLLGVLNQTYIDYPAGSMFWFRPDAIKQLLQSNLSYRDFPKEPIANDGTVAHAIERLFGYVTRLNGYDFIELNYNNGLYSQNFCHKNFNQYQAKSFDQAKALIDQNTTIIFDIFDTLLSRPLYEPDNLLRLLEYRVDQHFSMASNFFEVRKSSENALRTALQDGEDVTYDAIYDIMAKEYPSDVIDYLKEQEFALELALLHPKEEMVELLQYAQKVSKQILFISDMYLSQAQIVSVFEHLNIAIDGVELWISSECGYRKDNGSVWQHLIDQKMIEVESTLVIGDNEVSDLKMPGDLGLEQNWHILSEKNSFLESAIGKSFANQLAIPDPRDMLLMGPVINHLFGSPLGIHEHLIESRKQLSPYAFGYTALAPMFYCFMAHLYGQHREKPIFFLAREGYFLKELFEHFVQSKGLELQKAPHYLLISRRAVLGAVEKNAQNLEDMILGLGAYEGTFANLIKSRLGLEEEFMEQCGIQDFTIKGQRDLQKAYQVLLTHLEIMNQYAQKERKNYEAYLERIGFFEEAENVVVDLGYSGTIQNYLHQLSQKPLVGEYFITTDKVELIEREDNQMSGYFANRIDRRDKHNIAYRYALVLEAYLTSNQGQLINFADNIQPQFKSDTNDITIQQEITQGIKAYMDTLAVVDVGFIPTEEAKIKEIALFMFEYTVKNRLLDTQMKSLLRIEDDFTGNKTLDILQVFDERGV